MKEMHRTDEERERMKQLHADKMANKHRNVDQQMDRMAHHFKSNDNNDLREQKLQYFQRLKREWKGNEDVLRAIDKQEHDFIAQDEHIKSPSKEEIDVDMELIKQKVHERMAGVHEMVQNRDVKLVVDKLKGHLKKGLPRGGAAAHHGDVGMPLPVEARNGLLGLFGFAGLVGVVRWLLDKRKRAKKGHTL